MSAESRAVYAARNIRQGLLMHAWSVGVRRALLLSVWLATAMSVQAATLRHVEDRKTVFEADYPDHWELREGGSGDEGYSIDSPGGSMLQLTLYDGTQEGRDAAFEGTKEFVAEHYQGAVWDEIKPINLRAEPGQLLAGKAIDSDGREVYLILSFLTLGDDLHLEVWLTGVMNDPEIQRLGEITRSLRVPAKTP